MLKVSIKTDIHEAFLNRGLKRCKTCQEKRRNRMKMKKKFAVLLLFVCCAALVGSPVLASDNLAKDVYNAVTYIPGPGWIVGFIGDWGLAGEAKVVYQRNMSMRNDRAANQAGCDAQSAYIKSLGGKQYVDKVKLAQVGQDAKAAYFAKNPPIPMPTDNERGSALKHVFFKAGSGGPLRVASYGVFRTLGLTEPGQLDPLNVFAAYNRPYAVDFAVMLAHGASFGFASIPSSGGLDVLVPVSMGLNLLAWDAVIGSSADLFFAGASGFLPEKYSPGGKKFNYQKVDGYYYSR
jgi:hypothetical protein